MSDLTAITVAKAVLEYGSAVCAELGSPINPQVGDASVSTISEIPALEHTDVDLMVFADLLNNQRCVEAELSDGSNAFFPIFRQRLVLVTDEHGHVTCHVGAVVDNSDQGGFVIEFKLPIIDRLVGTDVDRPLADKLRVCTYLVSLASQAVRVNGNAVSFLTYALSTLRELIRLTSLQQGNAAQQHADTSDNQTANIQPIHTPSIQTATEPVLYEEASNEHA